MALGTGNEAVGIHNDRCGFRFARDLRGTDRQITDRFAQADISVPKRIWFMHIPGFGPSSDLDETAAKPR